MAEKLLIRGSNGYRLTIILQVFFCQLFVCLFFAVQMASRHGSVTVMVNNGSVTCTVQALVTWLVSSQVKAQLLTAQVSFSKETRYFQCFFFTLLMLSCACIWWCLFNASFFRLCAFFALRGRFWSSYYLLANVRRLKKIPSTEIFFFLLRDFSIFHYFWIYFSDKFEQATVFV